MGLLFFKFNSTILAEGEGFEPSVRFTARRFSRPVPSTARPPLRTSLLYQTFAVRENGWRETTAIHTSVAPARSNTSAA